MEEPKVIEFDEECPECHGTGLYVGLAERDGAAVVCRMCNGTGKHRFKHTYRPFTRRKPRLCKWVYQTNPGIMIRENDKYRLPDFGGMSYAEWILEHDFPPKSEMREQTCPAWWYQKADYSKMPGWEDCTWGSFEGCPHFKNKDKCWRRFDREQEA